MLGGYLNDAALVRVFVEQSLDAYNWLTNLGFTHNGIAVYHSLGANPMPENPQAMRMNMLWNIPFVDGAWQGVYTKGRQHTGENTWTTSTERQGSCVWPTMQKNAGQRS